MRMHEAERNREIAVALGRDERHEMLVQRISTDAASGRPARGSAARRSATVCRRGRCRSPAQARRNARRAMPAIAVSDNKGSLDRAARSAEIDQCPDQIGRPGETDRRNPQRFVERGRQIDGHLVAIMRQHARGVEARHPFPGMSLRPPLRQRFGEGKNPASEFGQSRRTDHDLTASARVLPRIRAVPSRRSHAAAQPPRRNITESERRRQLIDPAGAAAPPSAIIARSNSGSSVGKVG